MYVFPILSPDIYCASIEKKYVFWRIHDFWVNCPFKSGSFGHFRISIKKTDWLHTDRTFHTTAEMVRLFFLYIQYIRILGNRFWSGFNVILSFEFLAESAATAHGPSMMKYCICVSEEAVTCYSDWNKFDLWSESTLSRLLSVNLNPSCFTSRH